MKNKKAAMEMSMGTIVTIVLLMSVLVLGIFFVQKIFNTSNSAIDQIDNSVQSEINKLFDKEGKRLALYPTSQEVTVKKGDGSSGFAFSVMNDEPEQRNFVWNVEALDTFDFEGNCGSTMTKEKADGFILVNTDGFTLSASGKMEQPELVIFKISKSAPSCTIPYKVTINLEEGTFYTSAKMYVTLK